MKFGSMEEIFFQMSFYGKSFQGYRKHRQKVRGQRRIISRTYDMINKKKDRGKRDEKE